MDIEIKSTSQKTIKALFDSEYPEGVTLYLIPPRLQCDTSVDWLTLIVSLSASVPVGIFINWLSKYLIDHPAPKITINRKEIYYDEGKIIRMIEETRIIEGYKNGDK